MEIVKRHKTKNLTNNQRKRLYKKLAKLEAEEYAQSIRYCCNKFNSPKLTTFYNLLPELEIVTGRLNILKDKSCEIQEIRVTAYLLATHLI